MHSHCRGGGENVKICKAAHKLEFQVSIFLNSLHLMWSIFMYSSSFAFRSTSLCWVVELNGKYCNKNFHASPLTSGLKPPKNVACKLVGKIHKQQPIWSKKYHLKETTVVLTPGFWGAMFNRTQLMKILWRSPFGSCLPVECFHSHGHHLLKFIGTKERVYIRKESHRTSLVH